MTPSFENTSGSPGSSGDGPTVRSLAQAIGDDRDVLQQHLTRYAGYHDNAFSALNTAFMEDGAFIHVARGQVIEKPIHVVFMSVAEDGARYNSRQLDPYVARLLAEEAPEVQRSVIGILSLLKTMSKSMSK